MEQRLVVDIEPVLPRLLDLGFCRVVPTYGVYGVVSLCHLAWHTRADYLCRSLRLVSSSWAGWHKKNPCHVQKKMLWTLGMLLDRTWAFPKDGFGLQNTQLSDKCTVEIPGSLSLFGI